MFLEYSVPGAWWPVFSLRLRELGFSPVETAWAFAGSALGAILASLVAGQVADRWVATEKCMAFCAATAGILLLVLAQATGPVEVCLLCLGIWLMVVPILTLGMTLSMTHLHNPEQQFSRVRMWGTVGWVMSGWLLGYWFTDPAWLEPVRSWLGEELSDVADSQRLAALLAFALGCYALTLPHTPPAHKARSWLAPLEAIHLFRRRSFTVFCLCAFCLNMTFPFTQQLTPLLLQELEVPLKWVGPTLTIAQSMEVVTLFLLPVIDWHLGRRYTMLLGMVTWAAALAILTLGQPAWLVIGSQALNGFCITCYLIRGHMFINRMADPGIRASAQGLVVMLNGFGLLLGNLLVGLVRHEFAGQFTPTFAVGLSIATAATVLFLIGFEKDSPLADEPTKTELPLVTESSTPPTAASELPPREASNNPSGAVEQNKRKKEGKRGKRSTPVR